VHARASLHTLKFLAIITHIWRVVQFCYIVSPYQKDLSIFWGLNCLFVYYAEKYFFWHCMFVNYAPDDFTHCTFHLDANVFQLDANVVSLEYYRYPVIH
jgi:hypothetical protein